MASNDEHALLIPIRPSRTRACRFPLPGTALPCPTRPRACPFGTQSQRAAFRPDVHRAPVRAGIRACTGAHLCTPGLNPRWARVCSGQESWPLRPPLHVRRQPDGLIRARHWDRAHGRVSLDRKCRHGLLVFREICEWRWTWASPSTQNHPHSDELLFQAWGT
jgi:hypothetical protein